MVIDQKLQQKTFYKLDGKKSDFKALEKQNDGTTLHSRN